MKDCNLLLKNEIFDKMSVDEDLSETKHGMKSTCTQVDINQGTSCSRHCKKIFLIQFSVSQSLATMFFNGCQPLVQRCDGNDTSFRSSPNQLKMSDFAKNLGHLWVI